MVTENKTMFKPLRALTSRGNLRVCSTWRIGFITTIYKISNLIRGRSERFSRLPSFRQWIYMWLIHLIPEKFFGHSLYIRSLVPVPLRKILRFFLRLFHENRK